MSRAIRFRAWDMIAKVMLSPEDVVIIPKRDGGYQVMTGDGHRYELLQDTGLVDKNGTPIFEGDVLVRRGNHNFKYVVKWSDDLARYGCKCKFLKLGGTPGIKWIALSNKPERFEVIGNRYEHPDLLEQAKEPSATHGGR